MSSQAEDTTAGVIDWSTYSEPWDMWGPEMAEQLRLAVLGRSEHPLRNADDLPWLFRQWREGLGMSQRSVGICVGASAKQIGHFELRGAGDQALRKKLRDLMDGKL